jgi:hypothetical protein
MEQADFERLHHACSSSLTDYIFEAQTTCAMLGECSPRPLSLEKRVELNAQRSRENEAHTLYQEVRVRLFEAATVGYVEAGEHRPGSGCLTHIA